MSTRELPYIFDLLYDVKDYEQVDRIARGEPDCSDADPQDLVALFKQEGLALPPSLKQYGAHIDIWVHKNGTWLRYEPLPEEMHNYRKAKIEDWIGGQGS